MPRGRPPGTPKTGGGSRLGSPNIATKNAREAIGMLVEGNIPRMQGWLDEIAKTDGPAAAWRCLQDVIEYHIPKLARTEHTGPGGGPVLVTATPLDEQL